MDGLWLFLVGMLAGAIAVGWACDVVWYVRDWRRAGGRKGSARARKRTVREALDITKPMPPPSEPPPADLMVSLVPMMTKILESNAELTAQMVERGLSAVTTAMERAAFGVSAHDPPDSARSIPNSPPTEEERTRWEAPPWADWAEGEVNEQSDLDYPDTDLNDRPRFATGPPLPDLSGEMHPF